MLRTAAEGFGIENVTYRLNGELGRKLAFKVMHPSVDAFKTYIAILPRAELQTA
jgi:hypothetical protein